MHARVFRDFYKYELWGFVQAMKTTFLALCAATLLLTGCAVPRASYDYTEFRQSKPRSILVLPPLNDAPDIRATYSVLATVTRPLAESGYYVFPVALVDQTFKENGLPHPGDMHAAALPKIREIFGADAVLYLKVMEYGAKYQLISSTVTVSVQATLVDAVTQKVLWEGRASASDAENQGNSGGGLLGVLLTAVIQQIASSMGDPGHAVADTASTRLLTARPGGLLYGPRSPHYQQDGSRRALTPFAHARRKPN